MTSFSSSSPQKSAGGGQIEPLLRQLKALKADGVRTAITVHDMEPHDGDPLGRELYRTLYANADIMHHMGTFSRDHFAKLYPEKHHFIAQHPIYYDVAGMGLSQADCKRRLGLPTDKKVVMAFGQFRSDEEISMFLRLRKTAMENNAVLFAQRIETGRINNGLRLDRTLKCLRRRAWLNKGGFIYGRQRVAEDMVPAYFAAADMVFIQRKQILNSGNLPMAFSAARPVIGPDRGNVGHILRETNNYLFDPAQPETIEQALRAALTDGEAELIGQRNHQYALENMAQDKVFATIQQNIEQTA